MVFAALNGMGLALLVPCCQSLTADLYPPEQRGRAFGTLQLTASLGGMLGGVFATNVGGLRPAGVDGWRAAFHAIALLSLLVGECGCARCGRCANPRVRRVAFAAPKEVSTVCVCDATRTLTHGVCCRLQARSR
jgi:MFS family permease